MTSANQLRSLYAGEYQWFDGVTDAILIPTDTEGNDLDQHQDVKCVEGEISRSAFSGSPATLGFQAETSVFSIWQTEPDQREPAPGFQLDIGGIKWAIHSVVHGRYGHRFDCLCSRHGQEGLNYAL